MLLSLMLADAPQRYGVVSMPMPILRRRAADISCFVFSILSATIAIAHSPFAVFAAFDPASDITNTFRRLFRARPPICATGLLIMLPFFAIMLMICRHAIRRHIIIIARDSGGGCCWLPALFIVPRQTRCPRPARYASIERADRPPMFFSIVAEFIIASSVHCFSLLRHLRCYYARDARRRKHPMLTDCRNIHQRLFLAHSVPVRHGGQAR